MYFKDKNVDSGFVKYLAGEPRAACKSLDEADGWEEAEYYDRFFFEGDPSHWEYQAGSEIAKNGGLINDCFSEQSRKGYFDSLVKTSK